MDIDFTKIMASIFLTIGYLIGWYASKYKLDFWALLAGLIAGGVVSLLIF